MVAFLKDKRGAAALQAILFLPVLILLVIGLYEVWKVINVQQVLNDAAYQGARLLAMQPNEPDTHRNVDALVRRYVSRNPFVDPDVRQDPYSDLLEVAVSDSDRHCGGSVQVQATLRWNVGSEWGRSDWASFLDLTGELVGTAQGVVLCERPQDMHQPE